MTVVSAMLALLLPLSPLLSCEHVAGTGDIAARTASVVVRFLSPPVRSAWTFSRVKIYLCLLYTSPSPRDKRQSRMPSSA